LEAQNEDLHKHLSERLIQIIKLKDELATKDAEIEQLKEELDEIRKERLILQSCGDRTQRRY
jgi:predicted nuclease with TOPRIM domain